VPLGEGVPLKRGHERGVSVTPLKSLHFITVGSPSVKKVVDRYRHADDELFRDV